MSRKPKQKRRSKAARPSKRPGMLVWLAAVAIAGGVLSWPELSALTVERGSLLWGESLSGTARVIDGDTLEIGGQRIRLHAIDAPESRQTCERRGLDWHCGQAASNALANRIGGRPVSCHPQPDRDRYNRIIATCMLQGEDLNGWMVQQGWAMAYRQYGRDYIEAENEARAARRGIWATHFVPPWDWRRGQR